METVVIVVLFALIVVMLAATGPPDGEPWDTGRPHTWTIREPREHIPVAFAATALFLAVLLLWAAFA